MIDTIIFDVGRVLVNWDYVVLSETLCFRSGKDESKSPPQPSKALTGASSTAEFDHTGGDCKRILLPRPGIH